MYNDICYEKRRPWKVSHCLVTSARAFLAARGVPCRGGPSFGFTGFMIRLMDKILHDPKDPKLWELWYIPYYGSCRILSINRSLYFPNQIHGVPNFKV